jgi:hypothetical protein
MEMRLTNKGMTDELATETEMELEGHEKADELAACTAPTVGTKAADEEMNWKGTRRMQVSWLHALHLLRMPRKLKKYL